MQRRLDVRLLAEEITRQVVNRTDDQLLQLYADAWVRISARRLGFWYIDSQRKGSVHCERNHMTIRRHFREINKLFFPRWNRDDLWRVSTRSRRRVHGHCDPERKVIEIVVQHIDPDERDRLFIHEICHAVAEMSHGKKWQQRMEKAARRAEQLGRQRLSQLLRDEVAAYQQSSIGLEHGNNQIRDALNENPDLTFSQIARWLADEYGLLVSEVATSFKRAKKVYQEAKREAQEHRALKQGVMG